MKLGNHLDLLFVWREEKKLKVLACARHTHTHTQSFCSILQAYTLQTNKQKNKKLHVCNVWYMAVNWTFWLFAHPNETRSIWWFADTQQAPFVAAPNESESLEVQMHWTSRWCVAPAVLAVVPSPICFFVVCSFCFFAWDTQMFWNCRVSGGGQDGPRMSINSGFHFQSIQSNEQFLPWRGQSTRGTHVGNHEPIWLFWWVLPLPWEGDKGAMAA